MSLIEEAHNTLDMAPHIGTLQRLAQGCKQAAEFGVRTGVSTWALLDALAPDGALHSWDIVNVWDMVDDRVRGDPRWTFHFGPSQDALAECPELRPELEFIDSSHDYHQTITELNIAAAWDAPLIVCHDWNISDVRDAVRGFCERSRYRLVGIEESAWGMAWLRKP